MASELLFLDKLVHHVLADYLSSCYAHEVNVCRFLLRCLRYIRLSIQHYRNKLIRVNKSMRHNPRSQSPGARLLQHIWVELRVTQKQVEHVYTDVLHTFRHIQDPESHDGVWVGNNYFSRGRMLTPQKHAKLLFNIRYLLQKIHKAEQGLVVKPQQPPEWSYLDLLSFRSFQLVLEYLKPRALPLRDRLQKPPSNRARTFGSDISMCWFCRFLAQEVTPRLGNVYADQAAREISTKQRLWWDRCTHGLTSMPKLTSLDALKLYAAAWVVSVA